MGPPLPGRCLVLSQGVLPAAGLAFAASWFEDAPPLVHCRKARKSVACDSCPAERLSASDSPTGKGAAVGEQQPYGKRSGCRRATALREKERLSASNSPTGKGAAVGERQPYRRKTRTTRLPGCGEIVGPSRVPNPEPFNELTVQDKRRRSGPKGDQKKAPALGTGALVV